MASIIFSSTFANLVSANEITDTQSPTNATSESNVTDETNSPTVETDAPTSETATSETENPVEETEVPTEATENTNPSEEQSPKAALDDEEDLDELEYEEISFVVFEIYAKDKDGVEHLYSEFFVDGDEGSQVTVPIKDMYSNVISVSGGDFKLVGNNAVGTLKNELVVKVLLDIENFQPSDNIVILNFIDENGDYVYGSPFVTIYGEPGSTAAYKPPTIAGYKYAGPSTLIIPDADEMDILYERLQLTATVTHVDENGNTIGTNSSITGKIGDFELLQAIYIPGYTYNSASNTSGEIYPIFESYILYEFGASDDTIVLQYNKSSAINNSTNAKKTNTETTKTLPKTGMKKTYIAVAGIALVAVGIAVFSKKKNIDK